MRTRQLFAISYRAARVQANLSNGCVMCRYLFNRLDVDDDQLLDTDELVHLNMFLGKHYDQVGTCRLAVVLCVSVESRRAGNPGCGEERFICEPGRYVP